MQNKNYFLPFEFPLNSIRKEWRHILTEEHQWSLTKSLSQSRHLERKRRNKDKKCNLLPLVYPPLHCGVSIFVTLLQCASVVEDCSAILTNSRQIEWAWPCIKLLLWIAERLKLEFRYGGERKGSGLGLPAIHQILNAFSTLVNIHFLSVWYKMSVVQDFQIRIEERERTYSSKL